MFISELFDFNEGNPDDKVDEGYWDDALADTQKKWKERKDREAAGEPIQKNPSSHDKNGVYVGDKDLAGRPTAKKEVDEAKGLKKRVKIVKGSYAGKTGYVGEVHHGQFKGAPKSFVIDLDGGGNVMLPGSALRLVKEE